MADASRRAGASCCRSSGSTVAKTRLGPPYAEHRRDARPGVRAGHHRRSAGLPDGRLPSQVVTDEPEAAAALAAVGAVVTGDEPDAGLNPALVHGARARGAARIPGRAVGDARSRPPRSATRRARRALLRHAHRSRRGVRPGRGRAPARRCCWPARPGRPPADVRARLGRPARRLGWRVEIAGRRAALAAPRRRHRGRPGRRPGCWASGRRTSRALDGLGPADPRPGRFGAVQATVRSFDPVTRSGTVLLDDGVELAYDRPAFDAGGVRLLRVGQRVRDRGRTTTAASAGSRS